MPAVIGKPRSFHRKFKFTVEIDDFGVAKWTKCSELSAEVAKVEQWEGGEIIANKGLGRVTFADITLERGATNDLDCWNWFNDGANAAANAGLDDNEYKRNLDIVNQSRSGKTLRRWNVVQGMCIKFVAGDWDNTSDENVMEMITISFDFFKLATS